MIGLLISLMGVIVAMFALLLGYLEDWRNYGVVWIGLSGVVISFLGVGVSVLEVLK